MYSWTLVTPFMFAARGDFVFVLPGPSRTGGIIGANAARARQAFRIVADEEVDQAFANFAAKIERLARIRAADQSAHFDRALFHVGELKPANAFVPFRIALDETFQFLAQFAHWHLVIEIENYCSEQLG